MPKSFKFTCAICGDLHEGSPSFGYDSPHYYGGVPEAERAARTTLTDDLCSIDDEDFFVRAILEIPIHGVEEPFLWGVWASLSETNFHCYADTFESAVQECSYFGWFSNRLPYYPDTLSLKTQVHLQSERDRPKIELEPTDHPLAVDFRDGISWDRAVEIAEVAMHQTGD